MTIAADIRTMHYRNRKHYRNDADRIAFARECCESSRSSSGSEILTFDDGSFLVIANNEIFFA